MATVINDRDTLLQAATTRLQGWQVGSHVDFIGTIASVPPSGVHNTSITLSSTGVLVGAGGGAITNIDYVNVVNGPPINATQNIFTTGTADPTGGADGDAHYNSTTQVMWFKVAGVWQKGGTINASEIITGTLSAAQIGANAITADKIDTNAVTSTKIAAGAVTAGKIAANSVTSVEIAANTITANQIVAGTITANELAAGSVTASKLNVGTLSAITSDIGTITGGTISLDGSTSVFGVPYTAVCNLSASVFGGLHARGSSVGVNGFVSSVSSTSSGVIGEASNGRGVAGFATSGVGVYASASTGNALWSQGSSTFVGNITQTSGSSALRSVVITSGGLIVQSGALTASFGLATTTASFSSNITQSGGTSQFRSMTINSGGLTLSDSGTTINQTSASASAILRSVTVFNGMTISSGSLSVGTLNFTNAGTTGSATGTFLANKPGSNSSNTWMAITVGGLTRYIPIWS